MWLASPALPVGGFSYSEGLEAAVDRGLVASEAQARDWLCDQLELSLARSELPVVAHAMTAWRRRDLPRIVELNDWVTHTRETHEMRQQSAQMGRSLGEWLRHSPEAGDSRMPQLLSLQPAPNWPVAFALAAALTRATPADALLACAFGWAENMTQAAIKAVPLGQVAGQRMLQALSDRIPDVVARALAVTDAQRQAHAPMLAILGARHEEQYSRLFRS